MKQWLPFLLIICVALLLPAVSIAARAADTAGACGDNLTWTFDEATGTLTIEGTGPMWDRDVEDVPWFSYQSSIKCVIIRDGVTVIGDYAFFGCTTLTEVTIPDSVTDIGDYAFFECISLTKVTIPDSVTDIGYWAFCGCDSLTEVTIPDRVIAIEYSAFDHCDSLTQVTIGDGVTYIGLYAFGNCNSLTDITVDNNNTHYCSIDGVLFDKSKTTLIQYPIGKETKKYIIPDSVTAIGNWAFEHCGILTEVIIPDNVTSIESYAFYYCTSLTQVTIGNGVTSIGNQAFEHCKSLTSIAVDNNNPGYCSADGVLFEKSKTILIKYPEGKNATTYVIPDSVTYIADNAFSSCKNLTKVTIPAGVTSIGYYAFGFCSSLTEVTIHDSVAFIGDSAFSSCHSLTQMTIPDSVTSIGADAFSGCHSLTQVTIPNSVIFIGEWAFYNSDSLTDVYYIGTEAQWDAITVNVGNDPLQNATIHYAFDTETGAVFIRPLLEGAESALIAAYADGKLLCAVTGKVGNDNYIPLAIQPDEIRIFYLGGNYQPVTAPDIIPLD